MPQEHNAGFAFLQKAFEIPNTVAFRTPTAEMTYGQLRARVIFYARHLQQRGVDRQSCVALDTNRIPEGPALALALALLGARWVRLTPELPQAALGVTHVLGLGPPKGVTPHNFHVVDASWSAAPPTTDRSSPISFEGYAADEIIACYSQSSGTTGRPKFIARTYAQVWQQIQQHISEDFWAPYSGFPPLSGIGLGPACARC